MSVQPSKGDDSSWNLPRNLPRPALRRPGSRNKEVRLNVDTDRNSLQATFEPAGKAKGFTPRSDHRQGRITRRRSSAPRLKVFEPAKVESPQPQEPRVQEVKTRTIAPLASRSTPSLPERMAAAYDRNRRKYVRARVG